MKLSYEWRFTLDNMTAQLKFTCSNLTTKTLEKGVQYVQS